MQAALALEESPWFPVRDGDPRLRPIYNRHYSSRGGTSPLICGPGGKLVLLTADASALFAWRVFRDDCPLGGGINCAVFRNESPRLSSALILAAEPFAAERWGARRLYTYVDPSAVHSPNPGYCFQCAGWTVCGRTPGGHGRPSLLVLEKRPGALGVST